jgi:hypothetical protein
MKVWKYNPGAEIAFERIGDTEIRYTLAPKSTPSLSPPVPLAPPVSLKFSFLATSTYVSTSARMTSETDMYALYSLSSSWCDICPEQEITRLGLRHNSTTFLTPGGGKALQMFDPPFTGPVPTVVIWLTGIRLNRSRPWRVRCRAEDVTPAGFTAVVESWDDSELEAAGVAWVAYDKEQSGIWSGGVQVQESGWICPIVQGQGEQQCDTLFKRWPIAMTAVNELIALQVGVGLYFLVQMSGPNASMIKWTVNPAGDGSVVRVGCVGIMLGEVDTEQLLHPHSKPQKGNLPNPRRGFGFPVHQ